MVEVELLLQAKVMQPRHRWSSQQQVDVAVVVVHLWCTSAKGLGALLVAFRVHIAKSEYTSRSSRARHSQVQQVASEPAYDSNQFQQVFTCQE
jgi:hypothetical protein